MRDVLSAVGRFLGFFFALSLTLTIVITAYERDGSSEAKSASLDRVSITGHGLHEGNGIYPMWTIKGHKSLFEPGLPQSNGMDT
jgi:hypothetical protein